MLQKLRSTHCGRPTVEEEAEVESATLPPPPAAAASTIGNSSLVTIDPESNPPWPPPSLLVSSEDASFRFFRMPNSNSSKPPAAATADGVEQEPSLLDAPSAFTTDDSDVAADSFPAGPASSTFSPSFSATAPSPSTLGTDSSKRGSEETLRSSILADKITLFRSLRLDEEEPEEVQVSATQSRRAPTPHLDSNLPTQASTHNTTKDRSFPTPSPEPVPPRTSSAQTNNKNHRFHQIKSLKTESGTKARSPPPTSKHSIPPLQEARKQAQNCKTEAKSKRRLLTAYIIHTRTTPGAASKTLSVQTTESTQHNNDRQAPTDHHEKEMVGNKKNELGMEKEGRKEEEIDDDEEEEEEGRGKMVERMGRVGKTTM